MTKSNAPRDYVSEAYPVANKLYSCPDKFHHALGEALYHADLTNRRKIADAFSDVWDAALKSIRERNPLLIFQAADYGDSPPDLVRRQHVVSYGMRTWGGSFMRSLGEALLLANAANRDAIFATWPLECKQYEEMATTYILDEWLTSEKHDEN